jgi:thiol-disulfide isomerase/thioredoxin
MKRLLLWTAWVAIFALETRASAWDKQLELRGHDHLHVWSDNGLVRAERVSEHGTLVWSFVLARAKVAPTVALDRDLLTISDAKKGYFLRDGGNLRVYRSKPAAAIAPAELGFARIEEAARSGTLWITRWRKDDWNYVAIGPDETHAQALVRLTHAKVDPNGPHIAAGSQVVSIVGVYDLVADDNLLTARQMGDDDAARTIAAARVIGHPATELEVARWLNPPRVTTLAGLRGQAVLLDIWANWCGPCLEALPKLPALAERWKGKGLTTWTVHSGEGTAAAEKFVAEQHLTLPVALDITSTVERSYGIQALPTYLLIDRKGIVRRRMNQMPTDADLEALLTE